MIVPPRLIRILSLVTVALTASVAREWAASVDSNSPPRDVLLLDSIGELASVYALGTVAFVGGSMVPRGGHNILEPASLGVPVVVGRFTENFKDILSVFRKAGAIREVLCVWDHDDAVKDLHDAFVDLLRDARARQELGSRAASVVQQHRGATERVLNTLAALLANPQAVEAGPNALETTP